MDMPKLTAEDRKEALRIALESRTKRADVRKKLSQGKLSAKQVIDMRDDEAIGRMRVSAFIEAMPGYGKAKTEKLMNKIGISQTRRLKGLGKRQLSELLEVFE